MKKLSNFLIIAILLTTANTILISTTAEAAMPFKSSTESNVNLGVNEDLQNVFNENIETFLALTPKSYKELTGKRLSIKEIIQLKAAQKMLKSKKSEGGEDTFPKGAFIILTILGWGFIPLGILSDWKGNDWWVNILLTMLCWLPGVIHALSKMKKYYN